MGCGSSKTSESKLKAQPIGPVYLLGGVNPERITRLLMPQWKLSGTDAGAPPGGVTGVPRMSSLTVTTCVDGHGGGALVMQVARRRYVGNCPLLRVEEVAPPRPTAAPRLPAGPYSRLVYINKANHSYCSVMTMSMHA